MSKPTSGSDLFAWAARGTPGARNQRASKPPRWAPRRKYGFAAALAVVVEEGRRCVGAPSPRDARVETSSPPPKTEPVARCPRCGVEGAVKELFGTRLVDGKRRPQSWCRACRREDAKPSMIREAELFAEQSVAADDAALQALPLWAGSDS